MPEATPLELPSYQRLHFSFLIFPRPPAHSPILAWILDTLNCWVCSQGALTGGGISGNMESLFLFLKEERYENGNRGDAWRVETG
jgi:hypothetical protein